MKSRIKNKLFVWDSMFFYHLNRDGELHHLYLHLHLKDSLCIDIQNSKLGRRWFESNGVSYGRVALWHSWVGWDVEWNFEQMVLLAPPTTLKHNLARPLLYNCTVDLPHILPRRPQSRTFYIFLPIQFYTAALILHFTDSIPANPCPARGTLSTGNSWRSLV